MAKQTFTTGQVLTAAQMTSLQQTAMGGGSTTAKTVSYTLVAADAGTVVQMNSASATTITVNTALFAAGDTVQIQNIGAGVCTVTAGTATVNTSATLALLQYDAGSLYFNTTSAALFFNTDAADASGGMTQISSTAMSTGTVSLTSISATYKNLRLVLRDLYPSTATYFGLQVNTDTGANYTFYGQNFGGVNVPDPVRQVNGTIVYLNYTNAKATDNNNTIIIDFNDYANTSTVKQIISNSNVYGDTVNAWTGSTLNTAYNSTSAISSIQIKTGAGTFSGGTAILYGVN